MQNQVYPVNYGLGSYYRQITDKEPIQIDIVRFLNAIKRQQFHSQTQAIRLEKDKKKRNKLKFKLPAICPAACFSKSHDINNLTSTSGFVSIDIDDCPDLRNLRQKLYNDDYLYSMFISPSGNGLKILFKANYTHSTFSHTFLALEKYFLEKYNVKIDQKCKNINRLMFISSDANLIIRTNSKIFKEKLTPRVEQNKPKFYPGIENSQNLTESIIKKIEAFKIDITQDYADWLKIAFALIAEFGITGLDYFHRISRFYHNYDAFECEKQYRQCYRSGSRNITIKSLYSIAKDYGISFKN